MTVVDVPSEAIEEARALNRQVEDLLAQFPSVHTVPPEVTRKSRAEGGGIFGKPVEVDHAVDRTIPSRGGDLPVRVLPNEGAKAVYFHIHGGGWVLGSATQQDALLWELAERTGMTVVSVDYRLAPEHPFPAGPDDCEDAATWLLEHAEREFGTSRLVIGGESAGAHLSALTLLRLRDDHGVNVRDAFLAANLTYGVFDLSKTPSQLRWGDRNLVLSGPIMDWFYECFTPGRSLEGRRDPAISPLYADLHDMPPALFSVGDEDMLLDDSLFMAARWAAAGNDARLDIYPAGMHGFNAMPLEISKRAHTRMVDFIGKFVAP